MDEKVYLVLENGEYMEGIPFGAPLKEDVDAEMVFTTAMTGYLEMLTDPSYYGQMVIQTFPLAGNYGMIPSDFESREIHLSALICREWCQNPSNFRSAGTLDFFLKRQNIPGICGVDTRSLTKQIRQYGTMNARLTRKAPPYSDRERKEIQSFRIQNAVSASTCSKVTRYEPWEASKNSSSSLYWDEKFHVAVWDFGAKQNIVRELLKRGCVVTEVPAFADAEEILSLSPDGILLSNGPGDPKENTEIIRQLKKLVSCSIPTFGICLGHQLLALSQGGETEKLKYGHRGANQPVKDLETGQIYMTSQNHGYAVKSSSLPENAQVNFLNLNDLTCEGISYTHIPAFSVQFHPEACAGPKDTEFLFDRFLKLMHDNRQKQKEETVCL